MTAAVLAVVASGSAGSGDVALAQTSPSTLVNPIIQWFGPYAITPNDTTRFNYTNFGADAVLIEWAFSNAISGELVCGNFGKPVRVEAGKGAIWDFSQTIDSAGNEVPHCEGGTRGQDSDPGDRYFDATNRHQMVAWIFIKHTTPRGEKLAVDLPSIEIFNSMLVMGPDGQLMRSMAFGRTLEVLYPNPVAPTSWSLQRLAGGQ